MLSKISPRHSGTASFWNCLVGQEGERVHAEFYLALKTSCCTTLQNINWRTFSSFLPSRISESIISLCEWAMFQNVMKKIQQNSTINLAELNETSPFEVAFRSAGISGEATPLKTLLKQCEQQPMQLSPPGSHMPNLHTNTHRSI